MIGISWGGFNGLQVAARRPPALKAVITMCASDDRYADDVHYIGGCVLGVDMLPWAATMLTLCAQPPDPAAVGRRWRETWLERLERTPAVSSRPGSRTSAATTTGGRARCARTTRAIEAPVYAVGGWADGYSNAVPAPAGGPARPAQGPDRPVVARLPAGRRARPGDRLPPGVPALVGPLAQGHRHRDHGRAARCAPGCRTSVAARRPLRRAAGPLGGRGGVALAVESTARSWPLPGEFPLSVRSARVDRRRRRRLVSRRRLGRLAARPARRGRALADASRSSRSRSRSRSSASRRSS